MKKRSCRRTGFEQEQHDRAIRVRKMTDAQLCAYLDELEAVENGYLRPTGGGEA